MSNVNSSRAIQQKTLHGVVMSQKTIFFYDKERIKGTSLKSSAPKGAVSISLRAKEVRVLPRSARSDRELAALQSTRNEPSTATVRRKRAT